MAVAVDDKHSLDEGDLAGTVETAYGFVAIDLCLEPARCILLRIISPLNRRVMVIPTLIVVHVEEALFPLVLSWRVGMKLTIFLLMLLP